MLYWFILAERKGRLKTQGCDTISSHHFPNSCNDIHRFLKSNYFYCSYTLGLYHCGLLVPAWGPEVEVLSAEYWPVVGHFIVSKNSTYEH